MMDNQAKGLIKGLENWAKRVTKGYRDVDVNNLSSSFRDGLAFCAIIHHYRPDLIDFESLSKANIFENNNLAFSTAEKQLGIQALLDAEDMVKLERPDRLCIITYLSQLYNYFENQNKVKTLKPGIKRPQSNSSGPASKVAVLPPPKLLSIKHEVCHVCKHRVFILERLIVDNKLYHRDCFRCSKCSALLNPGAYVESDTLGLYECVVCLPEENSYSMDTQDTSYDSSEDRNGSLSNASSLQPSPILRKEVPSKPLISEAVNSARSSFLQNSLSSKSPVLRKISPILRNGASSAEDTSMQSVKDESADSGVSVRDKISVFESNRNSKFGSFSKTPELSSSSTLTPSSSAPASDSTTPIKSPRTSAILSFNSSSANKSKEVTGSAAQSKEATSKVEFAESATQPKPAVDRLKPIENSSISSNVIPSDSIEISETPIDTSSQLEKSSESQSDKLNCDNSTTTSVLSKVPNPTFRHSLNLEMLPKEENLSKISTSRSFQINEYKSPFKASRDIFQTSLQPLKLGIPTATSTPKKESSSLPQTPITSSPDSSRIGSVEIPQIRSTYSRTLPRPGSAGSLGSKDKHNEPSSTSETDLSNSTVSRSSSTGRRSSLESYSKGNTAASENANASGSIKSLAEENKGSSITSLKEKNSSFQLSSTLRSNLKSENSLFKRQFSDVPVPSVRHSLDIKRLSSPKTPESIGDKNSLDKPSDTMTEKSLSISPVDTAQKSNVEVPKIATKSVVTKVVKPKVIEPPKSEKQYPDDLNPFGDEEEEEYPDDLNPFGDDDDEATGVRVVSADDYDESKNPFASDEDDNAEAVQSKSVTPKTAPIKASSPFQSVWTSSPTGSLKGTTKKRKAPKPPKVTDIFPNDSQDSEADASFNSLKSSPSGSRISLQTPSPKLRKNKPAPPPPPVLSNKQNSHPDVIANSKQMKDADNMKLKSSTASTDEKQAKKKKRPAPPVPIPKRKDNKKIPLKEIIREMKEIEEKQKECERQGREIELLIRDRDKDEEPTIEEEEYIMQLFDLVNQKNALFRRQAELMYIKRSQRLEEQQAEIEVQIRQLLMKPDSEKTEEDRTREEELILELKDIVDQRSSIIDSIEMDRRRELEEDASVQEQIEIKNGDLPIAAEIKEKSSSKKKEKKAKKEKKKKDKAAKKEEDNNDESKKGSGKKKGLFK
ncbi:MICAL-like protein 2 [Araneus ventricosus]|uniref:MICAL-like protein 2 n=1 Tax=Araneus ventricosus TaxID=182803 RepID=A0A4Y2GQ01_ARAVE|nr:MICAL-like protein 2 [Araneus ventricosus]